MIFKKRVYIPGDFRIVPTFPIFPKSIITDQLKVTIWLEHVHIVQEYRYKYPSSQSDPYWADLYFVRLPKGTNIETVYQMQKSTDKKDMDMAADILFNNIIR
jgi:hypothetical protein